MSAPALRARHIVEVLDRHHVDYVLIGGYAAAIYGARRPTYDIDITPATTQQNLTRLAGALRELHAGIRVDQLAHGLPFDTSPEALLGMRMLNLRIPHGDIDLTFEPAGTTGYPDLSPTPKRYRSRASRSTSPHSPTSSAPRKPPAATRTPSSRAIRSR